jgi:hypothetical protein
MKRNKSKEKNKERIVNAGGFDVDAGVFWIGDPCYLLTNLYGKDKLTWETLCRELSDTNDQINEWHFPDGRSGFGLSVFTNEGKYKVKKVIREDGALKELRIILRD